MDRLFHNGMRRLFDIVAQLAILLFFMSAAACSSTEPAKTNRIEVADVQVLDEQLIETSGLYCEAGEAYTINDSGNSPTLFRLDSLGKVIEKQDVAPQNTDWESITADSEYFYIGDFGNNRGKRTDISIIKVNRSNQSQMERLEFSYEANDVASNQSYAHDFDAEAMVAHEDHLLLFSKSWQTRELKIYYLDKNANKQTLVPEFVVSGLPGVVTGADWDEYNQRFVVVGYTSNALGIFHPFIATLSAKFEIIDTFELKDFAQVEGVCVNGKDDIWFTQEKSPFSDAKLVKLKLPASH